MAESGEWTEGSLATLYVMRKFVLTTGDIDMDGIDPD